MTLLEAVLSLLELANTTTVRANPDYTDAIKQAIPALKEKHMRQEGGAK